MLREEAVAAAAAWLLELVLVLGTLLSAPRAWERPLVPLLLPVAPASVSVWGGSNSNRSSCNPPGVQGSAPAGARPMRPGSPSAGSPGAAGGVGGAPWGSRASRPGATFNGRGARAVRRSRAAWPGVTWRTQRPTGASDGLQVLQGVACAAGRCLDNEHHLLCC